MKNFREKKAKEQARNAEAKRKKLIDAEEFNILTFSFSSDAAEREKEYAEWKGKILRTYPDDGPTVKRLLGQLNESCKAVAKPDESYKTGFAYRTVSAYLDNDMKPSDFLPKREGKYTFSDKEFRAGQESYQMMKVKLDEYFRQNPDADVDAGMKFLERSREYIRQQTVNDLASAFNNLPGMQAETVRTEKGRKAVFKGKNFVRWAE